VSVHRSPEAGGTDVLGDALSQRADRLLPCVHCGFCLPACPTYNRLGDENDSPRGRLYLMRAVVEGRLAPESEAFRTHIDRCLGCLACESACPSGVEYGQLLEVARSVTRQAERDRAQARNLPKKKYRLQEAVLWLMARRRALRAVTGVSRLFRRTMLPSLLARLGAGSGSRKGPPGAVMLGLAMLAATAPSRLGLRSARAARPVNGGSLPSRGRVAVLSGCVQAGLFGRVGRASIRTLKANGYEVVEVEDQGCCGALHSHAGDLVRARALARANIRAFARVAPDWIAVDAAGCGAAMRSYPELFTHESGADCQPGRSHESGESVRVEWLAERVRDVTELLAEAGPRRGADVPIKVAYDHPCHLFHAQKVRWAPLSVLAVIPKMEVELVSNAEECCGGAGIYGITQRDLGGQIGSDKVDAVLSTGAELAVTPNPGCIMQIGAGLRLRGHRIQVVHPVELLDMSYRLAGFYLHAAEPTRRLERRADGHVAGRVPQ